MKSFLRFFDTVCESNLILKKRYRKCLPFGRKTVFVLLLLSFCSIANSQTTFTSSGTYTVPAGVTSITISAWGAGGGSGYAIAAAKFNASGGGGGGAFSQSTFTVTPGEVLTIAVGTGGTAGTLLVTSGGTGGTSSVTGTSPTVSISANGGGGGGGLGIGSNGVAGTAGTAGAAGSGYCIAFAGGLGTAGVRTNSGGGSGVGGAGGGGAGSAGAGGNGIIGSTAGAGTNSTGGTGAGSGIYSGGNGAGAAYTTSTLAGVTGNAPGGGAAGAVSNTLTSQAGAAGGAGQVIINPTLAPTSLVLTPDIIYMGGSFTASSATTTGYMVIRTTSATAPTTPVSGTTYTAGSSALGGYILSYGNTTSFTDVGLSASTQYWYWVYSYNVTGCNTVYSGASLNGNSTTLAQPGYIYIHLKSINEENSTDFPFNMTGPSSYSKSFSLNDNALANNGSRNGTYNYFNVSDEGLSHGTGGDGQLWAVGTFFNLNPASIPGITPAGTVGSVYYRNPGSSQWQSTGVTTAKYIDGAYANQFVYSNSSGNVIFYNNGTNTTIYTGGDAQDVTSNGGRIAISTGSAIKVYSLTYLPSTNLSAVGTWTTLTNSLGGASRLDMDAAGDTIVLMLASASRTVYKQSISNSGRTSLGNVGTGNASYPDVAYDDNGVIYSIANNVTYTDLIYNYSGGVWTLETPSRALTELTGGAGGLVYSVNLQAGAIQSIYSRQTDASGNIYWIDDERVKNNSSLNGNGIMIPVTPGTYTLTETLPSSSYDLGRYNIYDPSGLTTGSVSTQTVTLNVTSGDIVFAEYVNESLNPYSLSALTACNTTYYLQTFDASTSSPSRVLPAFGSATYGTPYSGTAYHYDSIPNAQDGYYYLVKNTTNWFTATGLLDHTGNSGYFLLVNAAYSQDEFYRQRLTNLIVGGNYKVTYYAANVNPAPPALVYPNIKIGIQDGNGTVVSSASTGNLAATTWTQFTLSFTATTSTTDLFITNNNVGGYGNDLAIDDITIQLLPSTNPTASGLQNCLTGTGSITITSPIASGLQYSDNGGTSYQSSPTFSGLSAATYSVISNYNTAATGCASTALPVKIIPSSSLYAMDNTGVVYTMSTAGAVTALNSTNAPSASTTADAVGYNPTDGLFYYFLKNASGAYTFNSYNPSLTTSSAYTTLASPAVGAGTFNIGGITSDGNGYYAIDTKGYLYYYSISLNTWTTITTLIKDNSGTPVNLTTQIAGGESFGDLTEDIYGDLWILISSGTKYGLYEITAPVSTTSIASLTAIKAIPYTTTLPSSTSWQGMAFDATGNLYLSTSGTSGQLYKMPIGSTTPSLVGSISSTTISISDMTQCSFTNNPLSVVWSYFNASPQNNEVNLSWGIAQASSVKGFYVERSSDSRNWEQIAFVTYNLNDLNYLFTDASPLSGANYYRIMESDNDGKDNYSDIKLVNMTATNNISVWPNPATTEVNVEYNGNENDLTAKVFDGLGRNVAKSVMHQGKNTISLGNIPAGIYFLLVQGRNKQLLYKKILKTNN